MSKGHQYRERFVLENGKHHSFNLLAQFKEGQSLDSIDGAVKVSVSYFDPRKKKIKSVSVSENYDFKPAKTRYGKYLDKAKILLGR